MFLLLPKNLRNVIEFILKCSRLLLTALTSICLKSDPSLLNHIMVKKHSGSSEKGKNLCNLIEINDQNKFTRLVGVPRLLIMLNLKNNI